MNFAQTPRERPQRDYLIASVFAIAFPMLSYLAIGYHPGSIVIVMIVITIYFRIPSKRKLTSACSLILLAGLFFYFLIRVANQ